MTANSGRIPGRILFSMGCHAGLNVPDAYVTDPSEQKDWAQTFAQQNAIWIANTGYGLGDTATVALSEELMRLLAVRLDGSMTAGQALQYAKQAYFGELGGYGVYDEKAMEEPVYYGLPMWRVGGAAYTPGKSTRVPGPVTALSSPTNPPAAGAVTNPTSDTGYSGLSASDVTVNPTFTATTTAQGSYWSIGGETQFEHYRPIEPRTSVGVTPPAGQQAHGALITGLTSQDSAHVDPVFARPTVDLSANEPEASFTDTVFPTQFDTLTSFSTPSGPATRLVLAGGQFFSDPGSTKGTQRLFTTMSSRVIFSSASSYAPPFISGASSNLNQGSATFAISATAQGGASGKRVLVLFHTADSPQWKTLDLTSTDSKNYTGSTPLSQDAVEWFAQVEDSYGNVATTNDKGTLFGSALAFHATVTGNAGANGWFTGPVTIDASGPSSNYLVSVTGGSGAAKVPATLGTDGVYSVTVKGDDGVTHTVGTIKIDQTAPTISLVTPTTATYTLKGNGGYTVKCTDNTSGVVDCPANGSVNTASLGAGALRGTIHDQAGNAYSYSLPYTVQATFVGFLQPVNDPSLGATSMSVFKYGSTLPLKFQLKDASGALVPDATAKAIANACGARLSVTKIATTIMASNESADSTTADSNGCFRYDTSAHQFIYNLASSCAVPKGGPGQTWSLLATVSYGGGVIARHAVTVATK